MLPRPLPTSDSPVATEGARVSLTSVATAVLWIGCLLVGLIGLKLPYPRPTLPNKPPEPAEATSIHVDVTNDPSPRPEIGSTAPPPPSAQQPMQPPALPEPAIAPPAPALTAVATPSPAIAFAVPVEGPARIVEARQAAPARTTPALPADPSPPLASPKTGTGTPDSPRQVTFGEGEGKQPAPEYPREAVIARQQGTVVLRFTVGADGSILSAEAAKPSACALLNQAAVRTVREKWSRSPFPRFQPGTYEVSIEFVLKHK